MDEEGQSTFNGGLTRATQMRRTNIIGSIRNNNLNYPKDQKFFHNSDVPDKAKEAASEMKQEIDKDIFKLKKPKWNASVSKAKEIKDDNDEINLFSIKKGLQDFSAIPVKETKPYEGCDSRNNYTSWNVSNQPPIALHNEKTILQE
jgi:hypothetical protein